MTVVVELEQDHWIQAVKADGRKAIDDVLAGSARLGRLSAAEPEDAVATLMRGSDAATADAFDHACLVALQTFRTSILSLKGPAFDVALSRLASLLAIVRRMRPRETAVDLHKNYVAWNAFFENFVIDRGLDLRREFLRILTLTQQEAEDIGLAPRRLMALWLAICGESGGSGQYDESYLRVALLGLRRLPLGKDFSSNEDFALHGLARWAASRNPKKKDFLREWHVLEGDFPRSADYWPPHVEPAIAAMERELFERTKNTRHPRKTFDAAAWWREDVDLGSRKETRRGARPLEPPPRDRHEDILRRVAQPFAAIKTPLDQLIVAHRRYADATGDVFYLVRTTCNVGMRLIEKGPVSERAIRGDTAVRLASLAFDYDPTNVFAWGLLLRGLGAADRWADAELVGWEAIRRFPEDPQRRNQLATMLAKALGRPEEAAALLRETISLFPDDEYPRNQLATVLAESPGGAEEAAALLRGTILVFPEKATPRTQLATVLAESLDRSEEAAALLRETVPLFPKDAFARNQLAMVLADDLGRNDEALTVLETAQRDGAANEATATLLVKLKKGQRLRGKRQASAAIPSNLQSKPTLDLPTADARRVLFRFEHGLTDLASVRDLLDRHAPEAYLAYVGERTGARPAPPTTTFTLAFEAAARKGSSAALRALIARARPLEGMLIGQAIAALESRTEPATVGETDAGGADRVLHLVRGFANNNAPAPARRLVLVRDMAASFLSTDVPRIAA
jgi:tetratricopeptide (TPR) repeat protein